MLRLFFAVLIVLIAVEAAFAQQTGHVMATPSPTPKASPSPPHKMEDMPGMQMPSATPSPAPSVSPPGMPGMNMPGSSPAPQKMNTPMPSPTPSSTPMEQMPGMNMANQEVIGSGGQMGVPVGSNQNNILVVAAMGSGTSWQPSSGPMYMTHWSRNGWLLMLHYRVFAGVNHQGGPRGATQFESANWFMPMAYHKFGPGTLQIRGMFSAEPLTFPPGGSPLLFQTGETYKGRPIVDRQHPHDLLMELSAQYTVPLGDRATWVAYFGYPGEPALGPEAFMHRASASENPSATLSHHLQDSTHITFGVLTTGLTYRWFKLEGSIFNGREPDENRYDFDAHKWNSRSARLTFAPNKNWSAQISYGFLRSPESQEPAADIRRATASLQYNRPFNRGNWASALIWGRNHVSEPGQIKNLNGYTAESTVNFLDQDYLYTRLELVDKDDLLRIPDRLLLGIKETHPSFRIGAYTFGGARDVWTTDKVALAVGGDLTLYSKPAILDAVYGSNPVGWKLFLRLRPAKMKMSSKQPMPPGMKH